MKAQNEDETPPGPIDLDHLGRQTLGRQELQREVLILFDEHAASQMRLIRAASTPAGRREAAHSLVGAAKGIGAFAVAEAAAAIETGADPAAGIATLDAEIGEARRFIGNYLAR